MKDIFRNIFEDFARMYITDLMEIMVNGCEGGLYEDVIEANDGKFTLSDIQKFIRFQHGDRDFTSDFSVPELDLLNENPTQLCQALLVHVDDDWNGKDYYLKDVCPDLIKNTKKSLLKIIEDPLL
jgi:hypothetical protein